MCKRMQWAVGLVIIASGMWQHAAASSLGYDPQADPFDQYHQAIAYARAHDKLVLIIAGGDWCSWCHRLDRFIERNDEVRQGLEEVFVTIKVYVGDQNYNELFFSQLPAARGAPHFWIVSPLRDVLASQSTGVLELERRGYDKRAFLSFIEHWRMRNHLAAVTAGS